MRPAKLLTALFCASFLLLPTASCADREPHYRVTYDEAYDDASLYQLLCEKFQDAADFSDAEVSAHEIVLVFPDRTERIVQRWDCMEETVEFHGDKKHGELVKVRQVAYANGENYTSSFYVP